MSMEGAAPIRFMHRRAACSCSLMRIQLAGAARGAGGLGSAGLHRTSISVPWAGLHRTAGRRVPRQAAGCIQRRGCAHCSRLGPGSHAGTAGAAGRQRGLVSSFVFLAFPL